MLAETEPGAAPPGPSLAVTLAQEWAGDDAYAGLAEVVRSISEAAKDVHRRVQLASLAGVLGSTAEVNVQGEVVQRLDTVGTELFVDALRNNPRVAGLVCEEIGEVVPCNSGPAARYLAAFDPIDGSSNIDVAVSIGSIFGFSVRGEAEGPVTEPEFLRTGRELIGAAYLVYGSSTVLIVATRAGVRGFTLDTASDEFIETHPSIRIPAECPYYSVNEGNYSRWDDKLQRAIDTLRSEYSLRYVGSLVSDFHRNLLKGGVFLYPADKENPGGKLRLLYEAAPLSFIAEQAGGSSSSGTQHILDIRAEHVHERTPLIVGNAEVVRRIEEMVA